MEKKPFISASNAPASTNNTEKNKNLTTNSNQPLTVDELDIEILPIIYEIVRR